MIVTLKRDQQSTGPMAPLAPLLNSAKSEAFVSPWIDATQDADGVWHLPEYGCEIRGLAPDDPKNYRWKPGDFKPGVDNVETDQTTNKIKEWGGQKLWEGERPPREWNPKRLPGSIKELLSIPHMPGQPAKEMFARLRAIDPRPFEDRNFEHILRALPDTADKLKKRIQWAEQFGVHSENRPEEWAGQELALIPSAYVTPRPDTVTVCVGVAGHDFKEGPPVPNIPGTEYDHLDLLYCKDQEGRVIQVVPFESCGATPAVFWTFSFIPPVGTSEITPFASFKIRGVWQGEPLEWNPAIGGDELKPDPEEPKLPSKCAPILWPENSWEGNCAKARVWDEIHKPGL